MTEETGKVAEGKAGVEGQGKAQEEMISKAELDKLQSESKQQLEQKQKELDEAKLAVLDPDYLNYLDSKKAGGSAKAPKAGQDKTDELFGDIDPDELESMPRSKFMKLTVKKAAEAMKSAPVFDQIKQDLGKIRVTVGDVQAWAEVQDAKAKYPDFWEYREDMQRIVRGNDALTIEDAYKLAKQNRKLEKEKSEKEAAAKAASEKPGGTDSGSVSKPKDYKSETDAAEDAWTQAVGDKETL